MQYQNEVEINIIELFFYLKKRLWLILIALVVGAVIGFTYSKFLVDPLYAANTRMYVLNRTNDTSVVYSDIQTSTYLSNDYRVLITGLNVTTEVVEMLDLPVSPEALASWISVSAPEGTRVLQINVVNTDPALAARVANAVREVAAKQIKQIMDVDAVNLVYEARVPQAPYSPNISNNTIMAAMIGAAVVLALLVIIFVLDDTIRNEEDVERYLGLGTLSVVPISADLDRSGKHSHGKTRPGISLKKSLKKRK